MKHNYGSMSSRISDNVCHAASFTSPGNIDVNCCTRITSGDYSSSSLLSLAPFLTSLCLSIPTSCSLLLLWEQSALASAWPAWPSILQSGTLLPCFAECGPSGEADREVLLTLYPSNVTGDKKTDLGLNFCNLLEYSGHGSAWSLFMDTGLGQTSK